jgi:glutaminyl-peptide cyclotransferase
MFPRSKKIILELSALIIIFIGISNISLSPISNFNGIRAYEDIITQIAFGSRIHGSSAHAQEEQFISDAIVESGWNYRYQDAVVSGILIRNIIGFRDGEENTPLILAGAHYDSRRLDDPGDNNSSEEGVPGANDGASGVAILLELMRSLPDNTIPVWMVFFDAEEYYGVEGRDGSIGSRSFVQSLSTFPRSVIIIDMVGDKDLSIYYESNSDPLLSEEIWEIANDLGFTEFIPDVKHAILDDHIPFREVGIPATLLIDFDYPYWHTRFDTADKVSPESLDIVGDTLWTWIVSLTY